MADVASEHGPKYRQVVPAGDNWTATAFADSERLVSTIRGGFADEVSRKVAALPCPHGSWCPRGAKCSYCTAISDVLLLLQEYR